MATDTLDLTDLLASWELALQAQHKAPHTLKEYLTGARFYLKWCDTNGHAPVLDRRLVAAWIAELLANGAEPATAHARLLGVRRFAAWLTDEGELDADPLIGIKPPKLDTKVVESLTDDQLRHLIKACAGTDFRDRRDEAIVRLMAETGIRAGELCALKVSDLELARGLAVVTRGKGAKGRVVPFGPQTATALDRYIRVRRHHRLAAEDTLWLGERGKRFGALTPCVGHA